MSSILISVEYSKAKPNPNCSFQQEPCPILMKEYNRQAKLRRTLLGSTDLVNIPWIAKSTPIHNNIIQDKAITILIGEIDAVEEEVNYVKEKIPEYW